MEKERRGREGGRGGREGRREGGRRRGQKEGEGGKGRERERPGFQQPHFWDIPLLI